MLQTKRAALAIPAEIPYEDVPRRLNAFAIAIGKQQIAHDSLFVAPRGAKPDPKKFPVEAAIWEERLRLSTELQAQILEVQASFE